MYEYFINAIRTSFYPSLPIDFLAVTRVIFDDDKY